MPSWITICDSCKRDDWQPETSGATDGACLAALVEDAVAAAATGEETPVRTRRHSCLMGCSHACNIAIQAPGKIAYTLGRFTPDAEAAEAIAAFAALHAASETGQVPYRSWPQPIKGHFVTRHPPLPEGA